MTRPGPLDMPESYEEYLAEIGVRPSYIVQLGQKLREAGFEIKSGYRTDPGPSGPGPWTRALHLAGGDTREAARIHKAILAEEGRPSHVVETGLLYPGNGPYEMNFGEESYAPEGYPRWSPFRRSLWGLWQRIQIGPDWRDHYWPPPAFKVRHDLAEPR